MTTFSSLQPIQYFHYLERVEIQDRTLPIILLLHHRMTVWASGLDFNRAHLIHLWLCLLLAAIAFVTRLGSAALRGLCGWGTGFDRYSGGGRGRAEEAFLFFALLRRELESELLNLFFKAVNPALLLQTALA